MVLAPQQVCHLNSVQWEATINTFSFDCITIPPLSLHPLPPTLGDETPQLLNQFPFTIMI